MAFLRRHPCPDPVVDASYHRFWSNYDDVKGLNALLTDVLAHGVVPGNVWGEKVLANITNAIEWHKVEH